MIHTYLVVIALILTILLIKDLIAITKEKRKNVEKPKKIDLKKSKKAVKKALHKRVVILRTYLENLGDKRRSKSIVYKYYCMMNNIIQSLHIAQYTNPESLSLLTLLSSLVCSFIICLGLNFSVFLLMTVISLATVDSLLYFASRSETMKRMYAIIDAEDLLSSSMEYGIMIAVRDNIKNISPLIRPVFEEFLSDLNELNESMEVALRRLNIKLGPQMDKFCENSLAYYNENNPSLLESFKIQITTNEKRIEALNRRQTSYSSNMLLFLVFSIMTVLFILMSVNMLTSMPDFLASKHGRISLILVCSAGLLGFCASQIIYSGGVD